MSASNVVLSKSEMEAKANWLREKVLQMAIKANSGHISTAYSQAELLIALYYGGLLSFDAQNDLCPKRDRFILSKGQGGIGLYPILADLGFFPEEEVINFTQANSILGVHADWHIPGVEVITGSLGHGLPIATGKALALKMQNKKELVFCLLGDGELYEGSNWEAAFSASHYELDNLVCIVDRNGQAVLGKTDEIDSQRDGPRIEPLDKKFEAFGFEVRVIDGHCFDSIHGSMADTRSRNSKKPLMIIAQTFKGKGLSLMEDQRMWHYRVPQGEDLKSCWNDLKGTSNGN